MNKAAAAAQKTSDRRPEDRVQRIGEILLEWVEAKQRELMATKEAAQHSTARRPERRLC